MTSDGGFDSETGRTANEMLTSYITWGKGFFWQLSLL
jgi:hypothetical protein